ncbi:YDG domain-containing protein [Flavobacterium lacus]|uniref:Putative secreted protein (Por secretion system target) n=1 Tax=Flavobacterium lacus TaxID=1353778 RepID=A0A328WLJ1_9FLAO|nr:YDG domain-containing protein [Flavobacterium lacus]RAR47212.1 putative secreted protein (Por secretion system target) [Flavobacterium lacus]
MKNFTFLNALLLRRYVALCVFLMSLQMGWGQYNGTGTFTKITSIGALSDGYYVIVNSGDTFAMNNSYVASTYLDRVSVSPAANTLTNPSSAIVWKIETNGGGRTIYNEGIQRYVSYTGTANNVQIVTNVATNNQRWNITYSNNLFNFANLQVTARILQYNASSPRFACYTSIQQRFLLYKMETVVSPTISTTGTLSAISTTYGTASSNTIFNVSGANMTAGIAINPPVGFQVSTTLDFSSNVGNNGFPITVGAAGTIASTPIYVRLDAATVPGLYSGNVVLSSPGATNVNVATVSSTVSTKNLTISGLIGANKVYDGNTTATTTGTASLVGIVGGDVVSLAGTPIFSFTTASVGNGKSITTAGYTLSGTHAARYTLSQPTGLTANITPKALTITANNVTKTAGVLLSGGSGSTAFSSDGLVGSQTIGSVSIAYGSAGATTGDGATPGTYLNQVTPSNAVGGTFSVANYNITYITGTITVEAPPSEPTMLVSGELVALSTIYGTPSTATSFTVSGAAMNEGITITPPVGFEVATSSNFSTTIGTNSFPLIIGSAGIIPNTTIYVRLRAVATVVGSPYAGNITLTSSGSPSEIVATIASAVSAKNLTISGLTASNKTYNALLDVSVTGTPIYDGLVNGESFTVTGSPTWSFATKTIGNGKVLNLSGTYLTPSTNYLVTQPSLTANITAKELTVGGASVQNKMYDANTTAVVIGATLVGVESGDTVSLSGNGTFASANAANGISVTTSFTLSGPDASNYIVTQPSGLTGNITPKALSIIANDVTKEVGTTLTGGSGSTAFTSTGLISGQTIGSVTIAYGTGAEAGAAVGTYSNQVFLSAATGGTFLASNYSITYVAGNIIVQNTTSIVLTNMGSAVVEDFDSMESSATASLPIGIRSGNDFTMATSSTTLAYGTSGTNSVTGTSSGGIINWANGVTASALDRAIGFLNTGSFTSPRFIVVSILNTTENTINSLEIDWDYEKYRSGSRAFDWTFFHGNDVSPSIAATEGNQSYSADANNTTVFNPPTAISKTVILNNLSIEAGQRYYFLWTFTGNGGSSNGQGIGIDNLSIKPCRTTSITSQPSATAQSTCINGTAFSPLSVTASGTDLVFQWEQSTDGVTGWIAAVGGTESTTNSFTPSNVTAGTNYYRCIITNGCGEIASSEVSAAITVSNNNNWIGTSGLWSDGANWSCGSIPLATSNLTISNGTPTLDLDFVVGSSGSLILEGTASLLIASNASLTIAGEANFNNRPITIRSNATGTASIGHVTGTLTGATNVTAERYIPAKRAWRLLTSPLKGETNTSIYENWQNNGVVAAGTGLLLWGPQGGGSSGLGTGPQTNIWRHAGTTWVPIVNSSNTDLFELDSNNAYLVYVTGPYGSDNITSGATATTFDATGSLITGDVIHTINGNQFRLIPNPYASPLNTEALVSSNTGSKVWMLDPTIGLGAYVTYDGQNWSTPTPVGNDKYIQSGQAFFVRTNVGNTFNIREVHKVAGNSSTWFERDANNITNSESTDRIRVLLYKLVANNWHYVDGALAVNSSDGNNEVDDIDAGKIANFNESLSFRNGTTNLSIEYRALPEEEDVQPIRLTATTATPYQIRLYVEHYSNSAMQPFLEDTQTGTLTAIPTDGSEVIVSFTGVVSNASTPDNRFRIVYESVLDIDQPTSSNFSVYPNPVDNGQVHIDFKTLPSAASYSISTLLGQHVQRGTLTDTQNTVFLTHLEKGIYLVQVTQDDKVITKKLYIQ